MDYLDMKNVIGSTINENGKRYVIVGPEVDNLTLVRFGKDDQTKETFWKAYIDDEGFKSSIVNAEFPVGSVLCHGKTAALILINSQDGKNDTFGLYDMKNLRFVPNEVIKMESLMANGSPFLDYNNKAFHTLCSDPTEFPAFLKENGLPKTQEGKVMFYDLANRIINLQKDNELKEIADTLYAKPRSSQKVKKSSIVAAEQKGE